MALVQPVVETSREAEGGRNYLEVRAGDDHQTRGPMFCPPGFDGRPLPGDLVLGADVTGQGEAGYAGAIDLQNAGKAEPGEGRIYARDANGALVCEIWARADGSIRVHPGPGRKMEVGAAGRKAVALDGDGVTIGIPTPGSPEFFTWAAAVNTALVALTGGTFPFIIPPTEITGATVDASAQELEAA